MFFGSGEVCYVDREIADIQGAYFLIVNILRMKLYWDVSLCLLCSDGDCMVYVL